MEYPKSALNTVKRGAKKASYDPAVVHAILDASEICHVAFLYEGRPIVQPINFGRLDNKLYLHGSLQNRMTNTLAQAGEVCLEVTHLDGMKLTRSAFHHSVNYRSVVIFGSVRDVTDFSEKLVGLKAIINHFVPNRWEYCREPNEKELKATRVLEITIETASAKIAATPPSENKEDLSLPYWGGTIPVRAAYGSPIADVNVPEHMEVPQHITQFINTKNNPAQ